MEQLLAIDLVVINKRQPKKYLLTMCLDVCRPKKARIETEWFGSCFTTQLTTHAAKCTVPETNIARKLMV